MDRAKDMNLGPKDAVLRLGTKIGTFTLMEAAKKVPPLMTRPLRGGRGWR